MAAKTGKQRQQAHRDRRKEMRRQQAELVLEVLDGIANGSNGITCTTTTDLWGINFDWKGEKSAYDAVEGRANALGFSLAGLIAEMEQRAVLEYQDRLDERREAQGLLKEQT